jgi:hypothetical protein
MKNKSDLSGNWYKGFSVVTQKRNELKNDITNQFDNGKDCLRFIPDFLDFAKEIHSGSSFIKVYNYSNESFPQLSKKGLLMNDENKLEIFLPSNKQDIMVQNDSIKYILFINFPEEVYVESGKMFFNTSFCFWDNQSSEIISYGKFNDFSTVGYNFNDEDIKNELVKKYFLIIISFTVLNKPSVLGSSLTATPLGGLN